MHRLANIEGDKKLIALIRAGASTYQIADELKCEAGDVQRRMEAMWGRLKPVQATVTHARNKLEDRLEALWRIAWGALTKNAASPDIQWHSRCSELIRQQAQLTGANAPAQHRIGGAKGAPPVSHVMFDAGPLTELSEDALNEAIERAGQAARARAGAIAASTIGAGEGTPPTPESEE